MKPLALAAIVTLAILTASPATYSFDGNRKGFVLGAGAGIGFTGYSTLSSPTPKDNGTPTPSKFPDLHSGGTLSALIGWGLDSNNLLAYETSESWSVGHRESRSQRFTVLKWYHYFGGEARSVFMSIGAGICSSAERSATHKVGGAVQVGLGYQFVRHLHVASSIGIGNTTVRREDGDYKYRHGQITFLIGYLGY